MNAPFFVDALYGAITFDPKLQALISAPIVQRLRHVRLSNIDSTCMPGIGMLSRFEHVLGVAHLAGHVGFRHRLSPQEQLSIQASALLHDWAITAFGHLVEEAFQYVGVKFDHEDKLSEIIQNENPKEIGGVNRQIFCGRETGLSTWAQKVAGTNALPFLDTITAGIRGKEAATVGRLICGDIDLDNIDNIYRMAYHMGLQIDRQIPLRLATGIVGLSKHGEPLFSQAVRPDVLDWVRTRRLVYEHLMLAEPDFSAKIMVLYAAVAAYKGRVLDNSEWNLTDIELIARFSNSAIKECRDTVGRWLVGEFWSTTPLVWMSGKRPAFEKLLNFSEQLSKLMGRECFSYGISDKRQRLLRVHFEDGEIEQFGEDSNQWLLGIGSPIKKSFSVAQSAFAIQTAEVYFESVSLGKAKPDFSQFEETNKQHWLL